MLRGRANLSKFRCLLGSTLIFNDHHRGFMAGSRGLFSALEITFLGTASAQPSSTRNHSALAMRLGGDLWIFDCGEATQHQLQKSTLKMGKIEKIFITHTHGHTQVFSASYLFKNICFTGDHIFGLIPLMAHLLNGAGGIAEGEDARLHVDLTSPVCLCDS